MHRGLIFEHETSLLPMIKLWLKEGQLPAGEYGFRFRHVPRSIALLAMTLNACVTADSCTSSSMQALAQPCTSCDEDGLLEFGNIQLLVFLGDSGRGSVKTWAVRCIGHLPETPGSGRWERYAELANLGTFA